ncbi:MAG: hypothetical protein K9J37_14945 [Saprospiraceae bacterium]|nr:hypothetical protein [Saprospiraceae bacterium]MCF8251206.1 hypothetical protein [Saprospiraceae bacterium]MCF8281190.1 hypothetical protein [Bacteroidales bacterium]MCF8313170.1 hypothetical protein [Saprospiraceae bacterium]MCF8441568.1 hypothetical protein [Saprospiraceae bacterium]
MKKLFLFSLALFSLNALGAQSLIAVHHEGQSSFFTDLPPAIDAALDGDTVYLPGGGFQSAFLDKPIHLVGVGYNPDSTLATSRTVVPVILLDGADGASVQGVYINSTLTLGNVERVTISRCFIAYGIQAIENANNLIISENVIGSYDVSSTGGNPHSIYAAFHNSLLSNNIFLSKISTGPDNRFANNVFISNAVMTSSLAENNVFMGGNTYSTNSVFYNNLGSGIRLWTLFYHQPTGCREK